MRAQRPQVKWDVKLYYTIPYQRPQAYAHSCTFMFMFKPKSQPYPWST